MNEIGVWIVDAFTDRPLTGNPAGVVLDSEGLDDQDCLRIASELAVSETAFVHPPTGEGADWCVRFFTPSREVDLCGHATVGAFWVLAKMGRLKLNEARVRTVQETKAGNLPVWILCEAGEPVSVMMGQRLPRFEVPELNPDKLAAMFGIGRKHIMEDLQPEVVNTGLRSLHIPLTGLASFKDLKPLRRGLLDLSASLGVETIQLFTLETEREAVTAHCRVFAPALGIEEDPVTGTAAGALGAYLVRHGLLPEGKDGITHLTVEQGAEVNRPGLVVVEIERDEGEFKGVRVGGRAVISLEGKLRLSR